MTTATTRPVTTATTRPVTTATTRPVTTATTRPVTTALAGPAIGSPPTEALPSPNIWQHPDLYERLNRAADPDGRIEAALEEVRPSRGALVVDVGCGTGFHLPRQAQTARHVIGVEPHPGLVWLARRRIAALANAEVRLGTAQHLPLPPASADIVVARWAYFFGPGCEPGLREAFRVLRHGGVMAVVDVAAERGEYGRWFRRAYPSYDPLTVDRFWARQGFTTRRLVVPWEFVSRADLEAVLNIEFPPDIAAAAIEEVAGTRLTCGVALRWRRQQ